jgi:Cu/Zn superoxide dismutase
MSTIIIDTITGKSTATTVTIGSTPVVSASANSLTIRGEGSEQTSVQQGLVKAWVNHDQATVSDSHNVGSVTDNGSGDYGTNFTNNMGNANYSAGGLGVHDAGSYTRIQTYDHDDPFTTAQGTINMQDTNGTQADAEPACTIYIGDLA